MINILILIWKLQKISTTAWGLGFVVAQKTGG
jgi:hypothetical protein